MNAIRKLKEENPFFFKGFIGISLLYALSAYFSSGFYHWDEYFQILEFTAYKWGITAAEDLPWEFREKMRPWLQSFILYPFKFLDPHWLVFLFRLVSGQLILLALLKWYFVSKEKFEIKSDKLYFWVTFLLWFSPLLFVRYSSENISSLFALMFFNVYFSSNENNHKFVLLGLLATLSFWTRYQMGILLFFPLFQILIKKNNWNQKFLTFIPFLIGCLIMIIIDFWGYGEWTISPLNYALQNIIYKKAANFGINPITDYLKWIVLKPTPLIGLPLLFSLLFVTKKYYKNPLYQGVIVFILVHNAIGHKEFRFLFPLAPFIPLYLFKTFEDLNGKKVWPKRFLLLNILILPISFKSLHPLESFTKITNNLNKVQLIDNAYPLALGGKGGLKFNLFYDDLNKFSKNIKSPYKFIDKTEILKKYLLDKKCKLIFSSREFIKLQFKYKILKKNKDIWSLVKC